MDLGGWQEQAASAAITLAKVVAIVVLAFAVDHAVRPRVSRILAYRAVGRHGALVLGRLVSVGIYVTAVLAIMGSMGASWTGLLAFVGAGTVTLGLALQDIFRNFFAGVFLLMERPFASGDRIRVRDVEGEVQGIDLRTTLVRVADGSLVMVPNSIVFMEILTNRSRAGSRRVELVITAAGRSIPDAQRIVHETLERFSEVNRPIPAPTVRNASAEATTLELSLLVSEEGEVMGTIMQALATAVEDRSIKVERR